MEDCDPQLEEAAADFGAGPWRTFRLVTFPMMVPGMISGGLLAFTLSLSDFVVSYFTSGHTMTLPILIYQAVKDGRPQEANALATVMIFVTGLIVVLVAWLRGHRELRN